MKKEYKKAKLLLILISFIAIQSLGQLQVDTTVTTEEMVQAFIGPGVTFSNAQCTGAQVARGLFSNGNSTNLGVNQGIALTSGKIELIIGPNTLSGMGFNNGTSR